MFGLPPVSENLSKVDSVVMGDAGGPGRFRYDGGPKPYLKKSTGKPSPKAAKRIKTYKKAQEAKQDLGMRGPVTARPQIEQVKGQMGQIKAEEEALKAQKKALQEQVKIQEAQEAQEEEEEEYYSFEETEEHRQDAEIVDEGYSDPEDWSMFNDLDSLFRGEKEIQDYLIRGESGDDSLDSKIENIDLAVESSKIKRDTTVYRGISGNYAAQLLEAEDEDIIDNPA